MPEAYEPIFPPDFLESVIGRARLLGKRITAKYGEVYISEKDRHQPPGCIDQVET